MASATGGSGGGRDHRHSSRGKGKNQVGPKEYKPSKNWLRAQLRYLSVPTPNPTATAPPSSSTEGKNNPPVDSTIPPKDG